MTDISSSTVVITGGASGIGRLMALGFAARGATVAVLDVNLDGAQVVAKEMQAATGREHLALAVDITDREAVYAAAEDVRNAVGDPDVVINNAGVISGKGSLLETPDDLIELTVDVNVLGLFWTTKAFLPAMVRRNAGHVVTIASASGMVGVSRLVEYAASKHAAIGFDESLRMELAEVAPGVRTTIVNPFYIDTGMFDGVATKVPWLLPILKAQDVADRVVDAVATGRRRVTMPWSVNLLYPAHLLPVRLFDVIINLLGVNDTMRDFRGRVSPEAVQAGPEAGSDAGSPERAAD